MTKGTVHLSALDTADEGTVDRFARKLLGRSWRTSLHGWLVFGCSAVIVADQFIVNPVLHTASLVCTALGLGVAGNGLRLAKDATVTGVHR